MCSLKHRRNFKSGYSILFMLAKELLEILVCAKCKGPLVYDKNENKLVCERCRLKFSVLQDDIPDMIIEDAAEF